MIGSKKNTFYSLMECMNLYDIAEDCIKGGRIEFIQRQQRLIVALKLKKIGTVSIHVSYLN